MPNSRQKLQNEHWLATSFTWENVCGVVARDFSFLPLQIILPSEGMNCLYTGSPTAFLLRNTCLTHWTDFLCFCFCFRKVQSSFQRTSSWKSTALLWLICFTLHLGRALMTICQVIKRMKECKMAVFLFTLAGSIWNLQTILSNTSASKTCDLDFFSSLRINVHFSFSLL